jgi:hypothetical protein
MDNIQNRDSYIDIPSSQTYRDYRHRLLCTYFYNMFQEDTQLIGPQFQQGKQCITFYMSWS